jgi:hypothetical protein
MATIRRIASLRKAVGAGDAIERDRRRTGSGIVARCDPELPSPAYGDRLDFQSLDVRSGRQQFAEPVLKSSHGRGRPFQFDCQSVGRIGDLTADGAPRCHSGHGRAYAEPLNPAEDADPHRLPVDAD